MDKGELVKLLRKYVAVTNLGVWGGYEKNIDDLATAILEKLPKADWAWEGVIKRGNSFFMNYVKNNLGKMVRITEVK